MTWLDTLPAAKVEGALAKARENNFTRAGRNFLEMAGGNDERFALWLMLADNAVSRFAGVGAFDLEDYLWRDAFDNGDSPRQAARDALANDETFSHLFDGE